SVKRNFSPGVATATLSSIASAGAMTSGPMPSPGRTAMWKPSLASMVRWTLVIFASSCPGLTRASIFFANGFRRWMDYRVKPGNPPGWLCIPLLPANLVYLFPERPLIERFAAAAAAGFRAVELQPPYALAPSAVKAELDRHGLTMLGINTAPGQ